MPVSVRWKGQGLTVPIIISTTLGIVVESGGQYWPGKDFATWKEEGRDTMGANCAKS